MCQVHDVSASWDQLWFWEPFYTLLPYKACSTLHSVQSCACCHYLWPTTDFGSLVVQYLLSFRLSDHKADGDASSIVRIRSQFKGRDKLYCGMQDESDILTPTKDTLVNQIWMNQTYEWITNQYKLVSHRAINCVLSLGNFTGIFFRIKNKLSWSW